MRLIISHAQVLTFIFMQIDFLVWQDFAKYGIVWLCSFQVKVKNGGTQSVDVKKYEDLAEDELPDLPDMDTLQQPALADQVQVKIDTIDVHDDKMINSIQARNDSDVENEPPVIPRGYDPITGEVYHNQMSDPDLIRIMAEEDN